MPRIIVRQIKIITIPIEHWCVFVIQPLAQICHVQIGADIGKQYQYCHRANEVQHPMRSGRSAQKVANVGVRAHKEPIDILIPASNPCFDRVSGRRIVSGEYCAQLNLIIRLHDCVSAKSKVNSESVAGVYLWIALPYTDL